MPDLLWESELPAGPGAGRFQLYRIADSSLHLTVDEVYGAKLTGRDVVQLVKALAIERVDEADL